MINRYFGEKETEMSDIQAKKLALLEWLASLEDGQVIRELTQWKEDYGRVTIDQYNQELHEADAAIDRGEFYTQEEIEERAKSW